MTAPFLLLSIFFVLSEPILSTEVKLRECSPKEIVVAEGKCSRYVNDLMFLTENYKQSDITLEVAKNISRTCQSVTNCFGSIDCSGSQKNKETYEQKCEKLDYANYDLDYCLPSFFTSVYEKQFNCSAEFDYFSTDMSVKRIAFTAGKSCLMNITSSCSSKSVSYLNSNYDDLLNILTVPSISDKCSSLHDELIAKQCEPIAKKMQSKMLTLPFSMLLSALSDNSTAPDVTNLCDDLKECMSRSCYFGSNDTDAINKICDEMDRFGAGGFHACLTKIAINETVLLKEYDCMGPYSHSTFAPSPNGGPAYWDNKKCLKTIMTENCDPKVMKSFDKEYDAFIKINTTSSDGLSSLTGLLG